MVRSIERRPPSGVRSAATFNHADVRQIAPSGPTITAVGSAAISGTFLDAPATTDFLQVAGGADTNFGNGVGVDDDPFTVMGWFYANDWNASYNKLFFKHNAGLTSDGMQFVRRDVAGSRFDLFLGNAFTGGGKYHYARYDVTTPISVWTHYCVRYDGLRAYTGIDFFVNGVKKTRTSGSANGYNGSVATNQVLNCGENFGCDIGDQMFLKRYASDLEVASIYQMGQRV